tara:strand:+ start:487 stop:750 length:264 start_codon:yes stop_codon:yes gene_type:complete
MKPIIEIKSEAHRLLEARLNEASYLSKPARFITEWERSKLLIDIESMAEDILDHRDRMDDEDGMSNLEAAAFIREAREEIEKGGSNE